MKKKVNKRMPTPKQKLIHNPICTSLVFFCFFSFIVSSTTDTYQIVPALSSTDTYQIVPAVSSTDTYQIVPAVSSTTDTYQKETKM